MAGRPRPELLIGGLGMGYTLRAAPGRAGRRFQGLGVGAGAGDRKVGAGADGPCPWREHGRSPGRAGRERRRRSIAAARSSFDSILLDVDNGPDALSRESNDRLYDLDGLGRARAALKPGGLLAIWSAAPDPAFSRRLGKAGFAVEEVTVRAHAGRKGAKHMIWLAGRQ